MSAEIKRKLRTADGKTILPYTTNIPIVSGGGILMTPAGLAVDRSALSVTSSGADISGSLITVGGVQTLSAGANAYVVATISGAATVLTFGIPRGSDGRDGADGSNGTGGFLVAPIISGGAVTTLDPSSSAYVNVVSSGGSTTLNFGIPRGSQGIQGVAGPSTVLHIGNVSTIPYGSSAGASLSNPVSSGGATHQTLSLNIPNGKDASASTKIMLTVPEDISGDWYLNVKLSKADGSVDIEEQSGLYGYIHVFNGSTWEDVDYVTQYHAGMPAVIDLNEFFVQQPLDFSIYKSSANDGVVTYYWSDGNEQLTDAQSVILGVGLGATNPSGMAAGNIANIARTAIQQTEVISGGSVAYIPVLSGGMVYHFTDPLIALSIGAVVSSLQETDILFTAGATVSPPTEIKVRYFVGEDYGWVDDEDGGHDETTPIYNSITLTSSGTGYAYAVPASHGWYEEYRDDTGLAFSSYLSAGSFTCSSAGGKWVISAHNVKQVFYDERYEYDEETEQEDVYSSTTSRNVNGLIASSTDNMTTWSINNVVTFRYCHWDGNAYDWQDDESPASAIVTSSTVTPCDVVLPPGALLVNSSAVTVESGHRYEMNLKHGAIVTGEIIEASNE